MDQASTSRPGNAPVLRDVWSKQVELGMRRMVAIFIACLLVFQTSVALARTHVPCCDGCGDAALCVAAACSGCSVQALMPVASLILSPAPARPAFRYEAATSEPVSFEIWRPPW